MPMLTLNVSWLSSQLTLRVRGTKEGRELARHFRTSTARGTSFDTLVRARRSLNTLDSARGLPLFIPQAQFSSGTCLSLSQIMDTRSVTPLKRGGARRDDGKRFGGHP
ncbi:hypothetical protein AAFF_G00292350 [Aldrovandia affinis]|uniref:Uncharacterized protein n=1 Tax=Aldrovandia affinis TaxID=143900 RepID=A0AAD7SQC0_9TELE|nr:hypothetical protein AAFF_G00292350 [Aldrovandia affinis]